MTYFHQRQYRQTQEQIIFFPRKKNELQEFMSKLFQTLHQNNFCFQNARSRFQDSFRTDIRSPN